MTVKATFTNATGKRPLYTWARNATFETSTCDSTIILRKAKALLGISGVRGTKEVYDDHIVFWPYGKSTVCIIDINPTTHEDDNNKST